MSIEDQIWYIHVNGQTKGPISLRDMDVLLRTNQINSRALGWKRGMSQWKIINQIQEIRNQIFQSSKEIYEIQKIKQFVYDNNTNNNKDQSNLQEKQKIDKQKKQQQQAQQDKDQIQNKDQDPLKILQATVQSLLKKTFYQSQDGKWNIFDQQKNQWISQDQEPIQQIAKMKETLFNQLKASLFFDEKANNNRRKFNNKNQKIQEPQRQLTKQQLLRKQKNRKKTKRAAEKRKQKWYKSKINTYIYISGLPLDISQQQLKQFVAKAGVLRVDLNTGQQKLKLYKDDQGILKGDAKVSYARPESVQIALQILNGADIRPGFPVKIQRAQFQQKQDDYIKRQSKKQNKVEKIIAKKKQSKMFSWDDNAQQQGDGLKIVILKHIFTPQASQDLQYIQSVKQEIVHQLGTIGQIQRIRFYQAHIDGVVQIKFKNDKDAEQCIHIMNGRFYDGRQLVCEYWDGETDYKRSGDLYDMARIQNFGKQLEGMIKGLQKIQQKDLQDQQQEVDEQKSPQQQNENENKNEKMSQNKNES